MKKAKILLTVLVILTVTCSSLAYKTRGFETIFYMQSISGINTYCTVPTIINSIITDIGRSTRLSTAPVYTACPTIQITYFL